MILADFTSFKAQKTHRSILISLKQPHLVLSSSSENGGLHSDLKYVINNQCCEGSALHPVAKDLHLLSRQELHQKVCAEVQTDPKLSAVITTAANMDYAAINTQTYDDTTVTAIATAGGEGNAGCAGDPAQWHESPDGIVPADKSFSGTINIILILHQSLSPSALVRSTISATEAKSAALQELAVPSKYSSSLSTGTGTDQIAAICPLADSPRFHWCGHHSKLGELIGLAVKSAVKEALRWQNGLEASRTRHLSYALGRFGLTRKYLVEQLKLGQNAPQTDFLLDSLQMLENDPRVSAQAYAIAAVLDRKQYGILPKASVQQNLVAQCALLATELGGKAQNYSTIHPVLHQEFLQDTQQFDIRKLVVRAIELGWEYKWK